MMSDAHCYESVHSIVCGGGEEPCAVTWHSVNVYDLWCGWEHHPLNALLNLKSILKATAVAVWNEGCSAIIHSRETSLHIASGYKMTLVLQATEYKANGYFGLSRTCDCNWTKILPF